jgi:hypothetical protein
MKRSMTRIGAAYRSFAAPKLAKSATTDSTSTKDNMINMSNCYDPGHQT